MLRRLLAADRRLRRPEVVFATAFDQYAVKAFEVNAVDYLLKPFDSKRLSRTLEKVRTRVRLSADTVGLELFATEMEESRHKEASSTPLQTVWKPGGGQHDEAFPRDPGVAPSRTRIWDVAQAKLDALLRMVEEQAAGAIPVSAAPARTGRVVVRAGSRLLLVDQKDVCFASIDEGRIKVVTKTLEGDSNVRTLEELAAQLDPGQFWRAHRSFLVHLPHIREVVPWFKSSYQLRMDDRNGTEIPVSRSQTKRLRELFNL